MIRQTILIAAIAMMGASAGFAQDTVKKTGDTEIDCSDPDNAENEICLALPLPGAAAATNFAPVIGGVAGAAALGLAAAGGGSSTSTGTTGTTGTN